MKLLISIFLLCFQTELYSQIYFWGKDVLKYDTNAIVNDGFLKENSVFSHFHAHNEPAYLSDYNYHFQSYRHKSSQSIRKFAEKYTPTLIAYTTKRLGEPFKAKMLSNRSFSGYAYFWKKVLADFRCIIARLTYADVLGIEFEIQIYKNEKMANDDLLYNTRGSEISVDSTIILKYNIKNF